MTEPDGDGEAGLDERRPTWGLVEPFMALFLGLVGAAVGGVIGSVVTGHEITEENLGAIVGSLVGIWLFYGIVIVATATAKGSGRGVFADLGLRAKASDVWVGSAAGLITSFVVVNIVYVVLEVARVIEDDDLDRLSDPAEDLADLARGPSFLILAIAVGLGAPIIEEVFFRGFLQPAAIRRMGPAAGIAFTSLVFGGVHLQALQFPALAAFGVVLGVLAHRTQRLAAPIAAHMVFNGITLVLLAL